MISTITITPTTNIKDFEVVNYDLVQERTYNSHTDELRFYNVNHKQYRHDVLIHVSLYNDLIVEGDVQYKILRMISK